MRPTMRFTHDGFLALREAERMFATGDFHIRPKDEIAESDEAWETDVLRAHTLIRFNRDAGLVQTASDGNAPSE